MALKSPQDMPKVELRPTPSTRIQPGQAPRIERDVVQAIEGAADYSERLRIKRQSLAKDAFDNAADTERIKSTAVVANSEGLNALDAAKKQREIYRKNLEAQLSKLAPESQEFLRPAVDAHLSKYDQTVIPHTYRESKKLEDNIKKERIIHNRNNAIQMSADLDSFDSVGLNSVYSKAEEYAKLKYGEDLEAEVPEMPGVKVKEIVQITAQSAVSGTIGGAIEEQAFSGNITGAKQILSRFNSEMLPADRVKAIKTLERAQNEIESNQALLMADQALKTYPEDLAKQEEFLRATAPSTKFYKQAVDIIKHKSVIEEKRKKKLEEEAQADVNKAIIEGKFDPSMVKGLDPDKQSKTLQFATNYAQGKYTPTDDKTFKDLDNMVLNSPESFTEVNLLAYRDKLNDREFRSLKMAQDRLRGEQRSQQRRIMFNPDKLMYGIRKEFIDRKGLYGEESELYKLSREWAEEELERNPKISPEDFRKKYAKVLYERATKTEKNPAYNRITSPIRNAIGIFGTTPEEIETISPSITEPEGDIKIHPSYVERVKKARPDLSEADVMQYLKEKAKSGIDLSVPGK